MSLQLQFLYIIFISCLFSNISCFLQLKTTKFSIKQNILQSNYNKLINNILFPYKISSETIIPLKMTEVEEFQFEDSEEINADKRTDEEKLLTHGYEGNYKLGDVVRVIKPIVIHSVKPYQLKGFNSLNFIGKVQSFALYGRKYKSLCSAITPIRVEFQPNDKSIPENMFEKKWIAHFASDELELIQSASEITSDNVS